MLEEFSWRGGFKSENISNVFHSHYASDIWSLNNHNHRPFWICGWGKLGRGNHVIIVTSSFSKSSLFKMFSVRTKTKSQRFLRPSVCRAFSRFWRDSVDCRPTREINMSVFKCGRNLSFKTFSSPLAGGTFSRVSNRIHSSSCIISLQKAIKFVCLCSADPRSFVSHWSSIPASESWGKSYEMYYGIHHKPSNY